MFRGDSTGKSLKRRITVTSPKLRNQRVCQVCQKKRSTFGYDKKSNLRCSKCAHIQYNILGTAEERRCNTQKKCRVCQIHAGCAGYDNKPQLWCSKCAQVQYTVLGITEDRRCDRKKNCQICRKNSVSCGYDGNCRLWCAPCARLQYSVLGIPEERRCNKQTYCQVCQKKRSSFGYGNKSSLWCSQCAQVQYNTLGITEERRCNTVKKCQVCRKKSPTYGYDSNLKLWCLECAQVQYTTLDITEERRYNGNKLCQLCRKKQPHYGYDNNSKLWCLDCAQVQYTTLGITEERRCDNQKKCTYTYPDGTSCIVQATSSKPTRSRRDTSQKRVRKTHELRAVDYLREQTHLGTLIHNKSARVERSDVRQLNYFPDIVYTCKSWVVHIEIDENQHKIYKCECQRILEIAQSRGSTPTLLARYNPDTVHLDGTRWKASTKTRLELLKKVLFWALSDSGGTAAQQAWSNTGMSVVPPVLAIYVYYDDVGCIDEKGILPIQLRILSVDKCNNYYSEQLIPPETLLQNLR